MTSSNYQAMSDAELRDWVRYHPEDTEAFHVLMDRLDQRPKVVCRTDEEFDFELRKRIGQK
ncbi:hypothetical protein G7B40_028995 [Aetokthonos hydrillicola Thurmond2011]|jgi:hypothetical protein|uniref:Uncharacterized protein n=1 Tax=Aetokthonos hydrillicola Thurmond2011 TaxID=2712845 RepID=A0AAP5MCW3_9CYAN|nr:hypothetical protein [Aetokthonos hydrillicola]MBO3462355.1 hypothetical protein [Aetokthonos hydrillicola CCALA 1050]MBW4584228.1 hypothetical protein [Aetokthonos hydrillicola CCALA 1050]MDR9898564.1 hypothetical protein [Aetokthonos hydrillicola Thurmond2011]